jgi:hypothetical protein
LTSAGQVEKDFHRGVAVSLINVSPAFKPRDEFLRDQRFGVAELIRAALGR